MTIKEVWEEYKHLDYLLSDKKWLGNTILSNIVHDLWQAIREQNKVNIS